MSLFEFFLIFLAIIIVSALASVGLTLLWWGANRRPHWNERKEPPLTGSGKQGENPNGNE